MALLLLCALTATGCRKEAPVVSVDAPVSTAPAAALPPERPGQERKGIVVTVNGVPLTKEDVAAAGREKQLPEDRALALVVQAELVAQQARATGFPGARDEERMTLARRFLETVYSQDTLCGNITARQIHDFYQVTYHPDWPADIYKGEVVGVRCCSSLDDDCGTPEVQRCMDDNRPLMDLLEDVRKAWAVQGTPPVDNLVSRFPMLLQTQFGLIIWPGIPLDQQKKKRLFDVPSMEAVARLAPGEISHPVESQLGFFLFKVAQYRKAITADSPDFRKEAAREVCRRRVESTRKQYLDDLLKQAAIEPGADNR